MSAIIRAGELPITPWANGAGRKADILSGEGWLVGFAWLDRDAPFSDYAGHDRTIMLQEGPGFTLDLPAGSTVTVKQPFTPEAFDGAGPIACRTMGGPCRVLNAITAYPGFSHTVQVVAGTDLAATEPGPLVFGVVLRGTVGGAGPLDTLRLTERMTGAADALIAVVRIEQERDA